LNKFQKKGVGFLCTIGLKTWKAILHIQLDSIKEEEFSFLED